MRSLLSLAMVLMSALTLFADASGEQAEMARYQAETEKFACNNAVAAADAQYQIVHLQRNGSTGLRMSVQEMINKANIYMGQNPNGLTLEERQAWVAGIEADLAALDASDNQYATVDVVNAMWTQGYAQSQYNWGELYYFFSQWQSAVTYYTYAKFDFDYAKDQWVAIKDNYVDLAAAYGALFNAAWAKAEAHGYTGGPA